MQAQAAEVSGYAGTRGSIIIARVSGVSAGVNSDY
jgi:hypothetical protein